MKKVIPNDAVLIPQQANRVFEGQIFDVYQWPQKMFDDSEEIFEMLKRPDTVIVLSIVDNKMLIIDDEQPHTGSRLGFPGGRVDENEATLAAARREVLEETGYDFKNWRLIKVSQPHTKIEWFIYFYLAWDGQRTAEPALDNGEKITVKAVNYEELKKLVFDKAGYLGQAQDLFSGISSFEELLNQSEFQGKEVDR